MKARLDLWKLDQGTAGQNQRLLPPSSALGGCPQEPQALLSSHPQTLGLAPEGRRQLLPSTRSSMEHILCASGQEMHQDAGSNSSHSPVGKWSWWQGGQDGSPGMAKGCSWGDEGGRPGESICKGRWGDSAAWRRGWGKSWGPKNLQGL